MLTASRSATEQRLWSTAPSSTSASRPGYLVQVGEEEQVDLLTVDWDSEPVAGEPLTVVFMEHNWYSVRRQARRWQLLLGLDRRGYAGVDHHGDHQLPGPGGHGLYARQGGQLPGAGPRRQTG